MSDPFSRPLTFGDPEQIRALRAMNGERPYCPECYYVPDDADYAVAGLRCWACGQGRYIYGEQLERALRALPPRDQQLRLQTR